ncbi:MAG: ribbon-helix-helix domain-containing protein [Candidatus Methanosuratincola petrocarbonis]
MKKYIEGKDIIIKLPIDLMEKVDREWKEKQYMSRSEFIRRVLIEYFDKTENKNPV